MIKVLHGLITSGLCVLSIKSVEAAPRFIGAKHGPSWFIIIIGIIACLASISIFKEFVLDNTDTTSERQDDLPNTFFIIVTSIGLLSGLYLIIKGFMGGW